MVSRKGQAWTPEDDSDLRDLIADNAGIPRLRVALGRSGEAIDARLGKLGLRRTDRRRPGQSSREEGDA
ncbi:MAG: hypothetical protein JWN66_2746 [Sphingomonas bacterium]|uniref:hypothetical protein n=1 Tax=Sphingomonas bacterium TaxID=1895847 RepID=UPI0026295589|nr:hypothetical protein [Sphingomonas bacterium]MDB5705630.1 hypothetical protein [Sphingomonas bacterium]